MEKDDNLSLPAKQRILKAAEEIFAEKGYDGSSVSEIAKRAGISKTQIFYYFESKKDLLTGLIEDCMSSIMPYRNTLWDNVDKSSKSDITEFIDSLSKILETKRDIIRIGLTESFKNTQTDISIFEIFDPLFKDIYLKLRNQDLDTIDYDSKIEYIMNSIFHVLIPLYSFYILSDKFNEYYNTSSEKTTEMFLKSYHDSFIKYLLGQ